MGQAFLRRRLDWPTVANSALARVVRGLFPALSPGSLAAITAVEQAFAAEGRARLPGPVYTLSVVWGRAVAEAVLAWAATDGSATLTNCPYTPPVGPGLWEPTPPAFAPPLEPCWGRLRPLVLASGDACAPPPPPAYAEDPASAFFAHAREVYTTSVTLTEEQRTIARYWADSTGATGTPPGHWVAIMGQLARNDGLSLMTAAEGYARVGLAVADAFIGCWHAKYTYNLLRPETYITRFIDPAWLPLLITPGFPSYTSGHATQSGAAATVLTDLFGVTRSRTRCTRTMTWSHRWPRAALAPSTRRRRKRPCPGSMPASITDSTTTKGSRRAGASGRPSWTGYTSRARGTGDPAGAWSVRLTTGGSSPWGTSKSLRERCTMMCPHPYRKF